MEHFRVNFRYNLSVLGASWAILATFRTILGLSWAILNHLGHLRHNIATRREFPDPPGPIFGSCFGAQVCSETCSISVLFLGSVLDVFGVHFRIRPGPKNGPATFKKRSRKWNRYQDLHIRPPRDARSHGVLQKPIRNQRFQIGI